MFIKYIMGDSCIRVGIIYGVMYIVRVLVRGSIVKLKLKSCRVARYK